MRLQLAITVIALVAAGAAAGATGTQQQQLDHSTDVIRFFDNHKWMLATGHKHCAGVPWARTCSIARRLYKKHTGVLKRAAWEYQNAWWDWLPSKWQRIGACETGYGKRPGNWQHNSGTYQGAFGFAVSSWDAFVPRADPAAGPYPSEAYLATPRQQYEVALAIYRMYGLSGWGCRGA